METLHKPGLSTLSDIDTNIITQFIHTLVPLTLIYNNRKYMAPIIFWLNMSPTTLSHEKKNNHTTSMRMSFMKITSLQKQLLTNSC